MYNRNKRRATFLTSKITYDRTAKNDVPRVNSRKFHFPLVQQCVQSRCRKSVRFAGLEYYGFDPVIMETAFVTLCGVECASRTFSRENCTDGWVFARSKVSRFQPSKVVLCCVVLCRVVRSFDIPVYTRETRYAAWILTRRNCTHNCDATRSIIALESIIKRWTLARISYAIISGD